MFWTAVIQCDPNSVFFGFMGITSAIVFAILKPSARLGLSSAFLAAALDVLTDLGAAYGTAKSGVGVSSVGVMRPDLIMRSILPVIMAGILGIYGLIISIVISSVMGSPDVYSAYAGFGHLAGGLAVGLSSLAAGLAIGIVGDAGVRANAQQPKLFFGVTLILIFAEAIGLYAVALLLLAMAAEEVSDPPFLPFTILCKTEDLCFVHYQTPSPDQGVAAGSHPTSSWQSCATTPEVARIRARQEEEAISLIEAHLSEPYTITVYRQHLKAGSFASLLLARLLARVGTPRKLAVFARREQAYRESRLVGVVVSRLECIGDGPCLLHGAQAFKGCRQASGDAAWKPHDAGANPEEAFEASKFEGELFFPRRKPFDPLSQPHTQRAGLVSAARGVQCSDPPSSSLLCKCDGHCTASIAMLAVRPDMRGRGIGKQLVRLVLKQQQRLVRATQAAAFAAAPDCVEENRGICEAILSRRMPRRPHSSSMELKLRQVETAVRRAMVAGGCGEDAPVRSDEACNSVFREASSDLQEKRLVCRLQHCSLDMEAGNIAAFRLYTSVGFVIAGYKKRYYCSGKDAYKMLYIF
ncbi:hypothetical protein Emag_001649 [Eimeria magna]